MDKSGVLPLPPRDGPFPATGDVPASSFRATNGAAQAGVEEKTQLPGWEEKGDTGFWVGPWKRGGGFGEKLVNVFRRASARVSAEDAGI